MTNKNNSGRYNEFTQFDTLAEYGKKYDSGNGGIEVVLSSIKEVVDGAPKRHTTSDENSFKWVGWTDDNVIHEREIKQGFYYLISSDSISTNNENPAAIILNKAVSESRSTTQLVDRHRDDSLGYWPSYGKLSVRCRGVYLDWLASTRDDPKIPVGYVFIYFSGLEYRVMVDGRIVSNTEFIGIYREVVRLFNTYRSNYSFANYSAKFASYLRASRPSIIEDYDSINEQETSGIIKMSSAHIETEVAKRIRDGVPITAELALAWLKKSGVYRFTTPYERLKEEFGLLFSRSYNEKHPNGIAIKNNGSSLNMVYEPSNFAIGRKSFPFDGMPNPSTFTIQLRKLTGIADGCGKQLDAASRYLGKSETKKSDLGFTVLLPAAVIEDKVDKGDPVLSEIKQWSHRVVARDAGLTTTKDLWERVGLTLSDGLDGAAVDTKSFLKDSKLIAMLLEGLGFGVAPDKRFHEDDMTLTDPVILFRGNHTDDIFVSPEYYDAKSIILMAAVVAKSSLSSNMDGGALKQMDVFNICSVIMECVTRNLEIGEREQASLKAYALWQLTNSNSKIQLKPKTNHFRTLDHDAAASLVIEAAFADGDFNKSRINKAQKVYTYIAGSSTGLPSLIHRLQTTGGLSNQSTSSEGVLDLSKLARYESETKHSANILKSVFENEIKADISTVDSACAIGSKDDSIVDQKSITDVTASCNNEPIDDSGLDIVHKSLYCALIEKEVWSKSEVDILCQNLNLMRSGAIETINDWSFESIDVAVIEEDDDIVIDFESVEELEKLNQIN